MSPKLLTVIPAVVLLLSQAATGQSTNATTTNQNDTSSSAGIPDGKTRLVIEGWWPGAQTEAKLIYSATLMDTIRLSRDKAEQTVQVTFDILSGKPEELLLTIQGDGFIREVTGEALRDWSLRESTNGSRTLVVRPREPGKLTSLTAVVKAETEIKGLDHPVQALSFVPPAPALLSGHVKVETAPELSVDAPEASGVVPVGVDLLPEPMRSQGPAGRTNLAFRVQGMAWRLPLKVALADPEARVPVLTRVQVSGTLTTVSAEFRLTAVARVKNPKGASLPLLSGSVALTDLPQNPDWKLQFRNGSYVLVFDHAGEFSLDLPFRATVKTAPDSPGWSGVDFTLAPAAMAQLTLEGLEPDTQFQFPGAARPERRGSSFVTYLPADGKFNLMWKESRAEAEGKLFFSAEMVAQVSVSPGVAHQTALLQGKVMQGELSTLDVLVIGKGEVTRVQGPQVLAWQTSDSNNLMGNQRLLQIKFNQPQKEQFALTIQLQIPLGAFPESFDVVQLKPEGATRFAGFLRIDNEGAVRLETSKSTGLSQVSPEQFPDSDAIRTSLKSGGTQKFFYRFASSDFSLQIDADQILPELSVSEVLVYRLGENELSIEAEIELEIREAPIRELLILVPRGYALARVNASGLADYFLRNSEDQSSAELRLVYGQPAAGRQLVQVRLEQNKGQAGPLWELPPVSVAKAKSVRGHVGIAADPGYRLSPERTRGLTEVATAFFPKKTVGLQNAFRLSDPQWSAAVRIERLPQTVQADVMHLFSIAEGIAYGSSVINYVISGAPISMFRVELSPEYYNVEFTGKDVRGWQKTTNGFLVQLHTPVSGPYTLLAAYERPFKAQGETLSFTGARPTDAQSEQGHTIIISAYQFQVTPTEVSPGLLPLETAEVPAEYRLFFDAPILAAYRYTARPFNLSLALNPLTQGDSLSQVIDRAAMSTRISKEGQVLTDVRYFVKNRGNPHLELSLPGGTELWTATIDGERVVPVKRGEVNLLPLPQKKDPNAFLTVDLKLASRSAVASRVTIAAPVVGAPVLLTEWSVTPDTGRRLSYRAGTLKPSGLADNSGFSQLARTFRTGGRDSATIFGTGALALSILALILWLWTLRNSQFRWSFKHGAGTLVGAAAIAVAILALVGLADLTQSHRIKLPGTISFVAPVQQANSPLTAEVSNLDEHIGFWGGVHFTWPALLGIALWIWAFARTERGSLGRTAAILAGWAGIAWASLRWPNGAELFLVVVGLFIIIYLAVPALRALMRVPRRSPPAATPQVSSAAAGSALILLLGCVLNAVAAESSPKIAPVRPPSEIADSISHEFRVEDRFVVGTSTVRWTATKGQTLPVLTGLAVLTGVNYPSNSVKMLQMRSESKATQAAFALQDGPVELVLHYQVQLRSKDAENGFTVPVPFGLVNRAQVTVVGLDVAVYSPQAVSVENRASGKDTVANVVLAPGAEQFLGWRPRSRDLTGEKPVFYAEFAQLYVPTPGVIEGAHQVLIKPARGQLTELTFSVPAGATVTDVFGTARTEDNQAAQNATPPAISLWRFDPDAHLLRVVLQPAQSKPFTLLIRSQVTAGTLPYKKPVGLISVQDAAGQLGSLAIGAGADVQLDEVDAGSLSPINLDDFPAAVTAQLATQAPGLTVKRAFRYSGNEQVTIAAAPVSPEVRVESQQTVSMGDDRTVLAVNSTVVITRAGIFRLSFGMPAGFDVESISSPALSHWTESKTNGTRIVTLHLNGRTTGQQQVSINLAGPGLKTTNSWQVPKLAMREATKATGTLLLVPEQGMRLQPGEREGLVQLDPQRSGINQKGVLAFRVLQGEWTLAVDVEQVNSWVQVTSLQHATVTEAMIKVTANLNYQVENSGIRTYRVWIPTNAEALRLTGEQVTDFVAVQGAVTNRLQLWEVKLQRRVIGPSRLQASFQILVPQGATDAVIPGVAAADVNLQRGFLTIQSAGRLQLNIPAVPLSLQPTEWQSVPRSLQTDLELTAANFAFRLVDPSYELPLKLERHEAARLLPARVAAVELSSVISDNGTMLTHARLQILPGDKRLLKVALPAGARFWFAFVNQSGVWPWREAASILIPLEQQSRGNQPIPVEFFYASSVGKGSGRNLDLSLVGPKFDLPLENISWRVSLGDKWKVKSWSGSLELEQQAYTAPASAANVQLYLQNEQSSTQERTRKAEELLAFGNSALEQGDPQQARRAFQQAYGLSTHDAAFNEDARVQLHNVKLQQALVGLNLRQAANDPAVAGRIQDYRNQKQVAFTQKDAKELLDRNTSDDNAALTRLAERLIQQQESSMASPNALRASLPEQGRTLVFKRAVLVDPNADLRLGLKAIPTTSAPTGTRALILFCTVLLLGLGAYPKNKFSAETPVK